MITYEDIGVTPVINASGMMTRLGGASLSPAVASAMAHAGAAYVDMDVLKQRAGAMIAKWAGAESAWVTCGAGAGIAIMTAACVAGTDPRRIERLPNADWQPREIVVQSGHLINFGAPIAQMIRLGGGEPRPVGWANATPAELFAASLDDHVAAVLFVQSHHCVQKGMLPLADVIRLAHGRGIPVLVDAAAETDLRSYIEAGADLVTYSGGKAFGGPTSGIICGKESLVAACRAQEQGIARAMKVGKETIMGLLTALSTYVARSPTELLAPLTRVAEELLAGLKELPYTRAYIERDEAGRPIVRLVMQLDEVRLGFTAAALVDWLARTTPPVMVRTHRVNLGIIAFDPRPLRPPDVPVVIRLVREAYASLRSGGAQS
ncbi:PLP-dependent aminotransferase family protein [Geochorda subterranea]|uniref:L-seryl-tRNA(Ser) seleniumtransferase n=1 Tax=Geochorda subterranea TaxID=3109564 RepID=A0ABZ1BQP6_9FIRM|nr:hypothetical protein [Limnochorda sp. LNt]WRP15132.1 hypothetical protein VLY81_02880 [Limnochorda sp. LNt]